MALQAHRRLPIMPTAIITAKAIILALAIQLLFHLAPVVTIIIIVALQQVVRALQQQRLVRPPQAQLQSPIIS